LISHYEDEVSADTYNSHDDKKNGPLAGNVPLMDHLMYQFDKSVEPRIFYALQIVDFVYKIFKNGGGGGNLGYCVDITQKVKPHIAI
jgi:hypothetical protein